MHEVENVVDCPECRRNPGQELHAEQGPYGYMEVWYPCSFCEGNGYFLESDYIIMKLEGQV